MNGKQFIVATMFAVVLLTMAFIPISSQVGTYDPWLDVDENGKIEIKDFAQMALAYGTTGDPTKNVNVTNWPSDYEVQTVSINVTWAGYHGFAQSQPIVYAGGYSRITLCFRPTNMSEREDEVTISAYFVDWFTGLTPPMWGYAHEYIPSGLYVATAHKTLSGSLGISGTTSIMETKAPYFDFRFNCSSPNYSGWATFDLLYYLRNE